MKNAVAALLMAAASPAFAGCYDLDATQIQYDALNQAGTPILRPATVGQTMSFALADTGPNPLTARFYQGLSDTGATALHTALTTGLPQGDVVFLGGSPVQVQFSVDSFPWAPFEYAGTTAGLSLIITTGNESASLPRQEMDIDVFVINSRNFANNLRVSVHANTTDGEDFRSVTQHYPLPSSADMPATIGFLFDMAVDRSVWLTANGAPVVQLKDPDTQLPLVVPSGISQAVLSIGGYLQGVRADEDALLGNTLLQSTLFSDVCNGGTTTPTLPNGKPFKGNGNAYGIFGKPAEKGAMGLR
jgi:hypothetical protein